MILRGIPRGFTFFVGSSQGKVRGYWRTAKKEIGGIVFPTGKGMTVFKRIPERLFNCVAAFYNRFCVSLTFIQEGNRAICTAGIRIFSHVL